MTLICRAGEFQRFAPGSPLPTSSNCPIWRPAHPRAHAVTWRPRQEAPWSALFPQLGTRFLSPSRSQIPPTSMKCRCRLEDFPDTLLHSHAGHSDYWGRRVECLVAPAQLTFSPWGPSPTLRPDKYFLEAFKQRFHSGSCRHTLARPTKILYEANSRVIGPGGGFLFPVY